MLYASFENKLVEENAPFLNRGESMKFFRRIIDWIFQDGKLDDDDVGRMLVCAFFILVIMFILCVSTTVASYWYSILIQSGQ